MTIVSSLCRNYFVRNRKTNIPHDSGYKLEFSFEYIFYNKDACVSYTLDLNCIYSQRFRLFELLIIYRYEMNDFFPLV